MNSVLKIVFLNETEKKIIEGDYRTIDATKMPLIIHLSNKNTTKMF